MPAYRHKSVSLIVLVTLASLLSVGNEIIRGVKYDDSPGKIFLSILTPLFLGGSALYYLVKERRKYAYAFISIYYLGLIVATLAALYSVAMTYGVSQFVISTAFYLNHISTSYFFEYWFLVFTTCFTVLSVVIVILSSKLFVDRWNREKALSSMRNSDLVKEFCGCARRYWQYYGSLEKGEVELGSKALLDARWYQYELDRRAIRHSGLFDAFRSSDATIRDAEESKVLTSLEGRPEWEDVSMEHRTLAKLSALWKSFWRDNTD